MSSNPLRVVRLTALPPTPETFAPFGELIAPSEYGKHFSPEEAQLDLTLGQPRFYIMRSPFHGMEFSRITRHRKVTQCLGARNDRDWFIAVAPPDDSCAQPDMAAVRAFHVPGDTAIKLHRGTWHAGPFFRWDWIDFYNLEMVDTNQVDSEHTDFGESHGVRYLLDGGGA
jgi:ureidoglycolate hydrolase